MIPTRVDRLVARAMGLSVEAPDEAAALADLRHLADGDSEALERAIRVCLAEPASLATRHGAIELLARVRYEDPPASA
jgi:hypothetical protein